MSAAVGALVRERSLIKLFIDVAPHSGPARIVVFEICCEICSSSLICSTLAISVAESYAVLVTAIGQLSQEVAP